MFKTTQALENNLESKSIVITRCSKQQSRSIRPPMPRTKSWQVITSPPVVRHTRSKPRAKSYSPEGTVAKESKSGGKRTG